MSIKRTWMWIAVYVLLGIVVTSACAETRNLAFGYEIELPGGVEITKEEWTPENKALMYLLEGTYSMGQDKFRLRINYGFEYQLEMDEQYIESNNVSVDDIWLWMETTTQIKGAVGFGRRIDNEKSEMLTDQLFDLGDYVKVILQRGSRDEQSWWRYSNKIALPEGVKVSGERWNPELDAELYYITGTLENGSKEYEVYVYSKNASDIMGVEPQRKGLDNGFGISSRDVEGLQASIRFSGESLNNQMDMMSFAARILEEVNEERMGNRITVGDLKKEETEKEVENKLLLPTSSDIFSDAYSRKPGVYSLISVAEGRYTIEVEKQQDTAAVQYQVFEIDEGSVNGVYYGGVNENGVVVDEYTTYQYMLLPEDFPNNIEYMTDTEYLEMLEKALNTLGIEKADLLRELLVNEFDLKNPEIIENEVLKANHAALSEQIKSIGAGAWFMPVNDKKEQAIRLCNYWEIFDENTNLQRDYLVHGRRWLEVTGALIGRYMGGIAQCAIFDGALHLIRGNFDLRSIEKVEDWVQEDKDILDSSEQNENESIVKTDMRVVNTKSSPLTLRETAGKNGKQILLISKGEIVRVIQDGEWPLVEYNGQQGYVDGKYLQYIE